MPKGAKEPERKKTDEEILFPEKEIAGLKLRPWTLGDLEDLRPELRGVFAWAKESGVTTDNLADKIPEVLDFLLGGFARSIIAKTAKVDEDKVRALPLDKATLAMLTIIDQNWAYLKNSYGLDKLDLFKVLKMKVAG